MQTWYHARRYSVIFCFSAKNKGIKASQTNVIEQSDTEEDWCAVVDTSVYWNDDYTFTFTVFCI